jgi:hypothetical protein
VEWLSGEWQNHTNGAHVVSPTPFSKPSVGDTPPSRFSPALSAPAAAQALCTHHPPGQESGTTLVLTSGGGARHGHS